MDETLRKLQRTYNANNDLESAKKYIAALERNLNPLITPQTLDEIKSLLAPRTEIENLYDRALRISHLLLKVCETGSHSPEILTLDTEKNIVSVRTWFRDIPDYYSYPLEFLLLSDEEVIKRKDEFELESGF